MYPAGAKLALLASESAMDSGAAAVTSEIMTKEQGADGRRSIRILIVEDEWFVAMMLQDMLAELGHRVVAIASRLKEGMVMAEKGDFDFAILDVSLNGEMSHSIAEILDRKGLPYVFATGYSALGIKASRLQLSGPLVLKPYGLEDLRRILPTGWSQRSEAAARHCPPRPLRIARGVL
jgi:CheY-like chemotaxis protein